MIDILFAIILTPIAFVAGVFTIALAVGFLGGLFKLITKKKKK